MPKKTNRRAFLRAGAVASLALRLHNLLERSR
jgi:hypothetical protein